MTTAIRETGPDLNDAAAQPLYLVYGGRIEDPRGARFVDLPSLDVRGIFGSYEDAYDAWRGASQRHVDDAFIKYLIKRLR